MNIEKLVFLATILEESATKKDDVDFQKLYETSYIAIAKMLGTDEIVIGDVKYEPTEFCTRILSKKFHNKENVAASPEGSTKVYRPLENSDNKEIPPVFNQTSPVFDDFDNGVQVETQNEHKVGIINNEAPTPAVETPVPKEKLSVLDIKEVTLTNKEDPSDVEIIKFSIIPLKFDDNESLTDIAVVANSGEKQVIAVSKPKSGQRTLRLKILDKYLFSFRGDFEAGEFKTIMFPLGETESNYDVEVKSKQHKPEDILADEYERTFTRNIKGNKLYCFPLQRANEPNGVASSVIILETDEKRIVAQTHNNIGELNIDGKNYRVYGKWENQVFEIHTDIL